MMPSWTSFGLHINSRQEKVKPPSSYGEQEAALGTDEAYQECGAWTINYMLMQAPSYRLPVEWVGVSWSRSTQYRQYTIDDPGTCYRGNWAVRGSPFSLSFLADQFLHLVGAVWARLLLCRSADGSHPHWREAPSEP